MKIPDKLYDALKWVCLVCLPALATFLNVLLPAIGVASNTVSIVITVVTSLATFIGMLIGISTVAYNNDNK